LCLVALPPGYFMSASIEQRGFTVAAGIIGRAGFGEIFGELIGYGLGMFSEDFVDQIVGHACPQARCLRHRLGFDGFPALHRGKRFGQGFGLFSVNCTLMPEAKSRRRRAERKCSRLLSLSFFSSRASFFNSSSNHSARLAASPSAG
jgi:hypothetical protein